MNTTVVSAVVSAAATVLMTAMVTMLVRGIAGIRRDMRRFMAEHLYLLRVTDWAKVNLSSVFDHLSLSPTEPPPRLPDRDIRD